MDAERLRRDFPVLQRAFDNGPLTYLDSACTSLRPRQVAEAVHEYYTDYPVCGERSVHRLGHEVTRRVEAARARAARFFGTTDPHHVVFTKNATEAINLVAHGLPWKQGDVVVTTDKEHNSNWVPWLHRRTTHGIDVQVLPSNERGILDLGAAERILQKAGKRLRLLSLTHVSNADGVENPVRALADLAHREGALVLVDAAQSASHTRTGPARLGADLVAASAHKMLGPSGLGFLTGTPEAMGLLTPLQLGGNTVKQSRADGFDLQDLPHRLEAGLQNYAALCALPAMFDYLERVGLDEIRAHDLRLNTAATRRLNEVPGLVVHGPAAEQRTAIVPFDLPPLDSHDVAVYLDEARNVAIRSGAHCVHSYFARRDRQGWARASFHLYNTIQDVETMAEALDTLAKGLKPQPSAAVKKGA